MDPLDPVRAYYGALDAGNYDRLTDLLAPEFVQHRPDRTFEGREAFVRFMREDRPRTDTEHVVDALYRRVAGDGAAGDGPGGEGGPSPNGDPDADAAEVVARGRVLADGAELFGFADAFVVADGRLRSLRTYTA
ncbi:MAG: nuclear transport factor 2 family protein [Haloferacaceae archaeon]